MNSITQSKVIPNHLKTLLMSLGLAGVTLVAGSPVLAARNCQCVGYTANRSGINMPANAKDLGPILTRAGFTEFSMPQVNDIVIMGTNFPGSDTTFGHIGYVQGISVRSGKTYITVRSANQLNQNDSRARFTQHNCANVTDIAFGAAVDNNSNIAFYRKGVADSDIMTVSFSGISAPGGVNVRSGRGTNFSLVRSIGGNQRISFDAWGFGQTVNDLWIGRPDQRWYRIAGTNTWVASAVVNGNAPGSRPIK